MKAKDYLLQLRKLDKLIENKMAESKHWQDVAMSYGVSFSTDERVQSSGSKQKMADAVCEYIDIETLDVVKLKETRRDIISTIEMLNVVEYDLLHKVYVQHLSLNEAADELDKTYSWGTTVHGRALQHVQDILDARSCDIS